MTRTKKTHYVTLRLLFDEAVTPGDALALAREALNPVAYGYVGTVRRVDERTKAVSQRVVSFRIARVL